jgi:hypothetical protein
MRGLAALLDNLRAASARWGSRAFRAAGAGTPGAGLALASPLESEWAAPVPAAQRVTPP